MKIYRLLSLTIIFIFSTLRISGTVEQRSHEIKNFVSGNIEFDNQNWSIFQHPISGFIYFANSEGLVEFDGLTERIYKMPYNRGIRSVYIDQNGNIFTGGFEEFGYWKKDNSCGMNYVTLTGLLGVEKNDEIWKIYQQSGKIYFQSFTSIYVYDYKNIRQFKAPFTQLFMFPKEKGFLVQVLGHGLYTFENERYKFIPGSSRFATIKIHTIVPFGKSSYLIGSANNGLFILSGSEIKPFNCEVSEFLKYNTCNAGVAVNDSLFVFGTILNGIVEFNHQGKIKQTFNFSNGLKNNTVLSLYMDRDHGLWTGLDQGAHYLDILSPVVQYTNITGSLGTIYTILKKDDILFIGTNQGLFTAKANNSGQHYTFSDVRMVPGSQGQVWTLREFDHQVLCGHNEGTFLADDHQFRQISPVTGGWSLKPFRDYLIEGTYTGLVLLKKDATGHWQFRNKIEGFTEPSRHVEVDYMGFVWVSHPQRGIYKIELNGNMETVKDFRFFGEIAGNSGNSDVFKINNRIVFTGSDMLYTFDYDAGKIEPFKMLNDQLDEYKRAAQIIPFEEHRYWFVYENKTALFEIGLDFKAAKILEFSQKSIHSPGNDLDITQIDPRHILIPNHSGFVICDPSLYSLVKNQSSTVISRIVFQGKGRTTDVCSGRTEKIPYNQNNITVYFSDPSRFSQEEKTYFYRIPELEEEWHTTTLNNFSYNNVTFGKYTVQIKPDINAKICSAAFTISAPWYLTYMAFTGYALFAGALVYLGQSIFRNELRKQKRFVEMEVRRNNLENELDIKSNELMLTMRYLIQKNEILTELKQEVDALKEQSGRYPAKQIQNLERTIYQGLDSQTESWRRAMNNLKLSQEGFFRRLKEKHPDLTPNDLRLCSYLRMNFNSKEIAHLLNISGRGVEIGRYRLRKKMNLPHDVNLSEYLMEN